MAPNPIDFSNKSIDFSKPVEIKDALSEQALDYDCLPCRLMGTYNPPFENCFHASKY
jgi:hypothetical protein